MSVPSALQKLFPQLSDQLHSLNGDYVSQQSASAIVRCMRDLMSDPCNVLPESLLDDEAGIGATNFARVQLKKDALEDLKFLVSQSTFKCAPRFPGRTPSLISVSDKKSMIMDADLYPGYAIPKLGFCFDVSECVMDAAGTKAGFVMPRTVDLGKNLAFVHWSSEAKPVEEDMSKLKFLTKVRVVIAHKTGSLEDPISKWCVVKTAFTTNDLKPTEVFKFKDYSISSSDFVVSRASNDLDDFVKDVVYEENAKITQLDQCHEYTILKGAARRLAESFDQLSRISGEMKNLTALKKQVDDLKEKEEKDLAQGQLAKPADDKVKETKELKARWEESKGTYDRIKDAQDKWRLSPHCGYEAIRTSLMKAWTRIPCMLNFAVPSGLKSKIIFQKRYHALFRWSQNQPQPCRLVPDPYNLSHVATSASSAREHYFLESSARADCLVVGDYVASSSLDRPQSYMTVSACCKSKSNEKWADECFKLGGSDDLYAIVVDVGSCPSWRSLLIKDNFFELDFDGCGSVEVFKVEDVEFLSHVRMHLHFRCTKHHHTFLKWFEDMKRDKEKASFFFLRPFGAESLGRFHASFQYLLELCYAFCHIIAKGLLERHDHHKFQGDQHAYDSPNFKYAYYADFLNHEGCYKINQTVLAFLLDADSCRMRLLDFMPYGLQFRDDPTYKSCLSFANQVQDILFFLKETFKNLSLPLAIDDAKDPVVKNPLSPSHLLSNGEAFKKCSSDPHHQQNVEEFDVRMSIRHNQLCMNRGIHGFVAVSRDDIIGYVTQTFESFERFVDPFFVLRTVENQANPHDMRRLFSNLKRSIHTLEMGHVCSFSSGSPQFLGVAAIFVALRCRHNTNLCSTFQILDPYPHFERYFEMICVCRRFVQVSASHAYLAVPSSLSFGSASTANLHHLTEVNMRDPTGTNPIIDAVMTKAFELESGSAKIQDISPFLHRFREENQNRSNTVEFLAFLDSSRELLSIRSMRHGDEIQTYYWIPISNDRNEPLHSRLWLDADKAYPLTASVMNRGHQLRSTQSQALKFQFLHFALQLLESNFYKHSEHEFQLSVDLLAMWHDPRRGLHESDLINMFLCILPPAEFAKHEHIFRDVNALVLLMKAESHVPIFDNLNRDSFDVDGHETLPHCHQESWEHFCERALDAIGDDRVKRIRLWEHIRILAEKCNQSHEETFRLFWLYRVDKSQRADAHRNISHYLYRKSVDKVFEMLREFVKDFCDWIKSDPKTHVIIDENDKPRISDPQPLDRLVSGLGLAIDCLASLPRHVTSEANTHGTSPVIMYEQILDLLLLDSRPGLPQIHLLHSLDGIAHFSSDLHGILPSSQIALALQPSFVRLLMTGFTVCSLHFPNPLILGIEERTWRILLRSFENSAVFLSSLSSDSQINVVNQLAWVGAARAILQCTELLKNGSALDHWQPEADSSDLCRIVELCLECFVMPSDVCGNDCLSVAMDLLGSILPRCPCFHARVSQNMCLFRRFASLLPGSTIRASVSLKSSALKLLGVCFETGLQPHDFDDCLSTSRLNVPQLRFSPTGHTFGGGPLLNLGGIDLAAVDLVIKALHAPGSSKLVPWLVFPLSPIVAVAQICRASMMFGQNLKLDQMLYHMRFSHDPDPHPDPFTIDPLQGVQLLKEFVDCDSALFDKNKLNFDFQNFMTYIPNLSIPISRPDFPHESTAVIESSFWLYMLTCALVHLKNMLDLFVSFSLNKELSFSDGFPVLKSKQQAMLFPYFASCLDHPVLAPLVVLRTMPDTSGQISHFVSNPLCVPLFATTSASPRTTTIIEPDSEALIHMSPLVNELDSRVPVSAFNSFLSILQVLMNGRLKLVQQIYNENKSFIFSPGTYSYVVWNKFCSNLFETVGARLFDSAEPAGHFSEEQHIRFCMERMLFLADLFRLGLIDGSDCGSNKSPQTISFVVRVASSLAAIPARQASDLTFLEVRPPLMGSVWPLVIALFVSGNTASKFQKFDALHKVVDHLADQFAGLCMDLTGLSYKSASNFLDEHPSFPISDVLAYLDIQHVLPSQTRWRQQNFRVLEFPRCFLDHLSRILSSSGFFGDPASLKAKKERDIAIDHFLSFFSVETKSPGLSGIPSELLEQFVLNEALSQSLCVHNFRARRGKLPMLLLPDVYNWSGDIAEVHPFLSEKCSFDEQSYVFLKKLLFGMNFHNSSLVTSLHMLDFVRSFYSATCRRSKFLSMGFSSFSPQITTIANDLFQEYKPQHTFIQVVVSIICSLGCMVSNPVLAKGYKSFCHEHDTFVKKCFEFICSAVEDNFVVECVDPAALRPLQSEMSLARSQLQDMEFNALKKRSSWDSTCFVQPPHISSPQPPSHFQYSIERTVISSSISRIPVVRMEAMYFQNLKSGTTAPVWKEGDHCLAQYQGKFYPAQVEAIEDKNRYKVSFSDYESSVHHCAATDLKELVGLAEVSNDMIWKRKVHVSDFVKIFERKGGNLNCTLWNQDKNTFLQPQQLGASENPNPFLFDNQDLLLLKAAFREDFRISGAKEDSINGVYELFWFNGKSEHSKYRINPSLFGPQGSHYKSFASYSKPQMPGNLDLPEMSYEPSRSSWVIQYGGRELASLEVPHKADLKHCLTLLNWKENGVCSSIRLELLTNSSSPTATNIRRNSLIRIIHKADFVDGKVGFKDLHEQWLTTANLVFESLSLYSKSSIFIAKRDCTLQSFLGCFSAMISLFPRDRAVMYPPPLRSICLILTKYLHDTNPDDPNNLLSSVQLSAVGVILSTFSLASEIPELFDPSQSSFVPLFLEYVLGRIYRELVCFCDSSIKSELKEQSSFCCSRSLDAFLSMCNSARIGTSLLSLASVLGAVSHCHHAIHLWECESSFPDEMSMKVWKIKESLFTYRSLGSTNNAYERSVEHRNFVKILRFLSLVCERSRREETFSLRSNLMLGNTMHLLVDSVSSNVDQPVPMDALNCVRLALECWPRIDVVIFKLKKSYESGVNVSVPTPQDNVSLGDLHELSAWISLSCNSMCALPTVFQPKLNEEMKMLVGHLVQCLYTFQTVITDLWASKLYLSSCYCGIKQLFWSSEENPSEDQLVNEHGRSVYVHQPLLLLCGAISHICYCLQTLYFFKSGPLPRVLKIDGIDENCDPDIIKHSLELLDALVSIFVMAQDSTSKSLDAEHFLHHFTDKEMTCFASAIESLFELCLRIRVLPIRILPLFLSLTNLPGLSPSSDPGRKAYQEHLFLSLVQKLHSASFSIKHHAGSDSANFSKQCEDWRLRSFQIYQRVFSLMQQCGDNLDLPKSLHFH